MCGRVSPLCRNGRRIIVINNSLVHATHYTYIENARRVATKARVGLFVLYMVYTLLLLHIGYFADVLGVNVWPFRVQCSCSFRKPRSKKSAKRLLFGMSERDRNCDTSDIFNVHQTPDTQPEKKKHAHTLHLYHTPDVVLS